ncbi:hypothetical protein CWI36_1325p0010 [Hamiltosporidium magnivora]|uniref:Uncharacterized protein n=1 Tax=Hamiltosporidium magnivora TaxID=148818 RepID=A0A4Q9L263_9MICR|nr:hypothetical protein CWI36_1325p0010 [Hamiltosporidium magnivora]
MLKKVIYKYNIAQPNVIGCSPIRVPRFRDGFNPRIVAEADKTEIVNNENDGNSDSKFLLQTDFFDKTCCPSNELLADGYLYRSIYLTT